MPFDLKRYFDRVQRWCEAQKALQPVDRSDIDDVPPDPVLQRVHARPPTVNVFDLLQDIETGIGEHPLETRVCQGCDGTFTIDREVVDDVPEDDPRNLCQPCREALWAATDARLGTPSADDLEGHAAG